VSGGTIAPPLGARLVAETRVVAALGRRSVRQAFRRPQFLAPIVVFPSLFLAVNTGGAGRAIDLPTFPEVHGFLDFQLAGSMVQSAMLAGVSAGISLALDVEIGFIDRLVAAPVSRSVIVLGRLISTMVLGAMSAVWFLGLGLIFGAHIQGGVVGFIEVVILLALCAGAFGSIGAAIALKSGRASVVQGIFPLVFVILFLSSAYFPRDLLLQPSESIAQWNPMSFIAEGIREPIVFGLDSGSLLKALLGIAIVGGIGAVMSSWALRARLREG
jgi:ABC-type multidrug transport system permease subunit